MDFQVKSFADLSVAELHAIYQARVAVFVVEQQCAYQEVDAADVQALHIFRRDADGIAAYCRLIPHIDAVHLGRVLVMPEWRAQKLGRDLVAFALALCPATVAGAGDLRTGANVFAAVLSVFWFCGDFSDLFGRWHCAYGYGAAAIVFFIAPIRKAIVDGRRRGRNWGRYMSPGAYPAKRRDRHWRGCRRHCLQAR